MFVWCSLWMSVCMFIVSNALLRSSDRGDRGCMLHGLNVTVAFSPPKNKINARRFVCLFLCLL